MLREICPSKEKRSFCFKLDELSYRGLKTGNTFCLDVDNKTYKTLWFSHPIVNSAAKLKENFIFIFKSKNRSFCCKRLYWNVYIFTCILSDSISGWKQRVSFQSGMVSWHSGPCHSGPGVSGPGLAVKLGNLTLRPTLTTFRPTIHIAICL